MTSIAPAHPTALSAEAFRHMVLGWKPAVAVFDCDGTLWGADAGREFMTWSLNAGMVSRDTADWILGRYAEYLRGEVAEAAMCGEMTQMYGGLEEAELRAASARFFAEHVRPTVFPEMLELARSLVREGCELWAVSSTNIWVIEEAVREFGIAPEHVLGSRVCIDAGHATERLVAVPTGPSKATLLFEAGLPKPDAVFGNSIHDAAMMATARYPCAVNPSPALEELAQLEGWPVYLPAAVLHGGRSGRLGGE